MGHLSGSAGAKLVPRVQRGDPNSAVLSYNRPHYGDCDEPPLVYNSCPMLFALLSSQCIPALTTEKRSLLLELQDHVNSYDPVASNSRGKLVEDDNITLAVLVIIAVVLRMLAR